MESRNSFYNSPPLALCNGLVFWVLSATESVSSISGLLSTLRASRGHISSYFVSLQLYLSSLVPSALLKLVLEVTAPVKHKNLVFNREIVDKLPSFKTALALGKL